MFKKSLFRTIPITIISAVFCDSFASSQSAEDPAPQTAASDPTTIKVLQIQVATLRDELDKERFHNAGKRYLLSERERINITHANESESDSE